MAIRASSGSRLRFPIGPAHLPREIGVARRQEGMLQRSRPRGPMINSGCGRSSDIGKKDYLAVTIGAGPHRPEVTIPRVFVAASC